MAGQANIPQDPALLTSFHQNEIGWSETNLPNELFRLEPPPHWGSAFVPDLLDRHGRVVRDARGRPYRAYSYLPDQISIQLEDFRLEMYTDRYDPRCESRDLYLRMQPGPNDTLVGPNGMNMRRTRLRNQLNITCWTRRTDEPSMTECLLIEQTSWQSIAYNTVLPVTPAGLLKPTSIRDSAAPPVLIPLNTFWNGNQPYAPSARLQEVITRIQGLNDKANEHGYAHWILMPNKHKPAGWIVKADNQGRALTGPEDITLPPSNGTPVAAFNWIKQCIREAAAGISGKNTPSVADLPAHCKGWIDECIREGRAAAISNPIMNLPIVAGSSVYSTAPLYSTAPSSSIMTSQHHHALGQPSAFGTGAGFPVGGVPSSTLDASTPSALGRPRASRPTVAPPAADLTTQVGRRTRRHMPSSNTCDEESENIPNELPRSRKRHRSPDTVSDRKSRRTRTVTHIQDGRDSSPRQPGGDSSLSASNDPTALIDPRLLNEVPEGINTFNQVSPNISTDPVDPNLDRASHSSMQPAQLFHAPSTDVMARDSRFISFDRLHANLDSGLDVDATVTQQLVAASDGAAQVPDNGDTEGEDVGGQAQDSEVGLERQDLETDKDGAWAGLVDWTKRTSLD